MMRSIDQACKSVRICRLPLYILQSLINKEENRCVSPIITPHKINDVIQYGTNNAT